MIEMKKSQIAYNASVLYAKGSIFDSFALKRDDFVYI